MVERISSPEDNLRRLNFDEKGIYYRLIASIVLSQLQNAPIDLTEALNSAPRPIDYGPDRMTLRFRFDAPRVGGPAYSWAFDYRPNSTQFAVSLVLATPILISPPEGALFSNYPRETKFAWEAVPGATAYLLELQYDQGGTAWSSLSDQKITGTSAEISFVGAQPGRWRITALDDHDTCQASTPSDWFNFAYTV